MFPPYSPELSTLIPRAMSTAPTLYFPPFFLTTLSVYTHDALDLQILYKMKWLYQAEFNELAFISHKDTDNSIWLF